MTLPKLWQLQCLYLRRQDMEKQVNLKEGAKLKQEKNSILERQEDINSKLEDLKKREKELRQKEDAYENVKIKYKEAENHLYSGQVNNPKELENIQEQLAKLQHDLDSSEEAILYNSENLDNARQSATGEQRELNLEKEAYRKKVEEYLQHKKELEKELAIIDSEIQKISGEIEPKLLEVYQKNCSEYGYSVLSQIVNKTCSQCHIGVPALLIKEVKQGQGLVKCENCGRILYWE